MSAILGIFKTTPPPSLEIRQGGPTRAQISHAKSLADKVLKLNKENSFLSQENIDACTLLKKGDIEAKKHLSANPSFLKELDSAVKIISQTSKSSASVPPLTTRSVRVADSDDLFAL